MQHYICANIVIENPVLAEIVQKYKDLGAFRNDVTVLEVEGSSLVYESDGSPSVECPRTLEGVTFYSFEYYINEELLWGFREDLEEELSQREVEINRAYGHVFWETMDSRDTSYRIWRFKYNPQDGETYEEELEDEDKLFERDW